MRWAFLRTCAVIASGCSFIDDWGHFTTTPGMDGGPRDSGPHPDSGPPRDAGPDSGTSCEACSALFTCATGEICAPDENGCAACCAGCDGTTCFGVCTVNSTTENCYCAIEEGSPCGAEPCAPGLECVLGACRRPCGNDGDCSTPGISQCAMYGVGTYCAFEAGDEHQHCDDAGQCNSPFSCFDTYCWRACVDDAECFGAYPMCSDFNSDGLTECGAIFDCDLLNSSAMCNAGLICRIVEVFGMQVSTACLRPIEGTAPLGDPCSTLNSCDAGLACFSNGQCMQLCYLEDNPTRCPGGTSCGTLQVTTPFGTLGVCA